MIFFFGNCSIISSYHIISSRISKLFKIITDFYHWLYWNSIQNWSPLRKKKKKRCSSIQIDYINALFPIFVPTEKQDKHCCLPYTFSAENSSIPYMFFCQKSMVHKLHFILRKLVKITFIFHHDIFKHIEKQNYT